MTRPDGGVELTFFKQSISFSAVQIHNLSYIHLHSSPSTGVLHDQLPDGFIAQLVQHRIPFKP